MMLATLLCLFLTGCSSGKVEFQAHRGLSETYPENTIPAYKAAIKEGYDVVELDPKMTKDGKCVLLHDKTINRTARQENGDIFVLDQPVSDMTLAELKKLDFGSWKDDKFKGTKIPSLAEVIDLIEDKDAVFKFDNIYEKFSDEQIESFFSELKTCKKLDKVGITCTSVASVKRAVKHLPDIEIHYDGKIDGKVLKKVKDAAKGHPLTFWIGYPNTYTSFNKLPKANKEICKKIKKYGKLGIWTIGTQKEYDKSVDDFHADIVETDGELSPKTVK